ncbi:retrovirus-related pol polyprotein from transposon TNT 1-94 [Tanacetum coccineum]
MAVSDVRISLREEEIRETTTKRPFKEAEMTKTAKVKGNALDAEIQIILLENVQSHRETRTKEHLLEVLGAIAVKKMMKRSRRDMSFEASSSRTKEIKFVKAQKKTCSDGGPIIIGNPLNDPTTPKINMGPPPVTPGSEKTVTFQKSILGPRPKHIIVKKVKVPVASDNEVKQFYKPLSKPRVGFSKPNFRSKTSPPRRVNNNYSRPKTPQPKRHVGRQNQPHRFPEIVHANMRLIQSLASKELVRNLPKLKFDQHFCDACKIRKQAHVSHKAKNVVSTTKCLELLCMDLFGPSAVRSYRGNRYTLVIVDDYSGYTWTRYLKNKTEAFDQFEIFSKKIQNQLGCTIVPIRTDHGREFDNEVQFGEFCNANGITHNFSAPRTPQSNEIGHFKK